MSETAESLGFDLPDTFACHSHLAPHFLKGISLTIQKAIAQL